MTRTMQTIPSQLEKAFREAISAALGFDADPIITVSQNEKFGDYQSNAAMGLAKQVAEKTGQKTNPRAIAEQIKAKLNLGEMASENDVTIAGPGFLNVKLSPAWVAKQLQTIAGDERLGINRSTNSQRVVVDYSGPNIAKEMHVGHLRSTIIGDAISRVIKFQGHEVIRQNHIGDWGTQFGRVVLAIWYRAMAEHNHQNKMLDGLIASLAVAKHENNEKSQSDIVRDIANRHQQWLDRDPIGDIAFLPFLRSAKLTLEELERLYQFTSAITEHPKARERSIKHPKHGPVSLADIPKLITTFIQNSSSDEKGSNYQEFLAWDYSKQVTLESCEAIYSRLGVMLRREDVRGESSYRDLLGDTVNELCLKEIAVASQGAITVFIDGVDKTPLLIKKTDGGFLYGTTDLAAIRYRINDLRAERIIYTHDSRQALHFSQVFRTAQKANWTSGDTVKLEYAPFGTMLGEDGRPFKTRSGDTVKLKDLLDEAEERAFNLVTEKNASLPDAQRRKIAHAVGIGAVKYSDLSKDRVSDYVFSWDKMLAMDGNTAPYLQYAYARIKSIFRKADGVVASQAAIHLDTPHETSLARYLLRLGEIIELVARELKPHHLCTYLYELATKFSAFYENCPVLQSDEPLRSSRLALADLTARTMALGLDLLGIEHPDQM